MSGSLFMKLLSESSKKHGANNHRRTKDGHRANQQFAHVDTVPRRFMGLHSDLLLFLPAYQFIITKSQKEP